MVFTTGSDPVAVGLVGSLNRPGVIATNATGINVCNSELGPKKLEMLHEMIPAATKIVLLLSTRNPVNSANDIRAAQVAAHRLGLEIVIVSASSANEIESAFATAVEHRATALQSGADVLMRSSRAGANEWPRWVYAMALPTITTFRESSKPAC